MIEGEDMEGGGMDTFKVIILCISQDFPEKLFHFCSATKLCPNLYNPMDCQVLSMEFSRQEYWSGLPFLSPGIFLTQESNPRLFSLGHYMRILNQCATGFAHVCICLYKTESPH